MYTIRGTDNSEYGPLSSGQVREWIAQRRVNANTPVRTDDGPEWKPLGSLLEFQLALQMTGAYPGRGAAPSVDGRKTSSLALAAFCCSVFGFCGVTAIVGLALGIVALVQIKKKPAELSGERFARTAIALSVAFIIALPLAVQSFGRYMQRTMFRGMRNNCRMHVNSLSQAVRIYSIANNGAFPPAEAWCDAIKKEIVGAHQFLCPNDTNKTECSYAFNARLGNASSVDPKTVVIFESDLGWNGSGGSADMISKPRHGGYVVVGLANGNVQSMPIENAKKLRWDP